MSAFSSSPNTSLNKSEFFSCYEMPGIILMDNVFNTAKVLLLVPLAVFILYLAYQRWKQQGSLTAASHCDIFTYHLAAIELFTALGTVFLIVGYCSEFKAIVKVGYGFLSVPYSGETFFHFLTCAERYLAVVHPHTYMGLKTARGTRIRNVIIGCGWILCFAWMALNIVLFPDIPFYFTLGIIVLWLAFVIFCSLSVLFVLIRSKPGERGRGKGGVDKSKQRAFLTIMAILVALCVWVVGYVMALYVNSSTSQSNIARCVVMQVASWINIPSSLVLPLLYLQRSGKLAFCCRTREKRSVHPLSSADGGGSQPVSPTFLKTGV